MRITSVHLENIKSYVDETVVLTPGTNAIWGPNGSGKTTLLEAIGFALFDFLPYSQRAFVREGQPFGTMRIRLIALDELEYEVVRQVGKTNKHHVVDPSTNDRLVEGTANVMEWLRLQVLGNLETEDPKFLFENAIGVPQSMMTSAFRGTPSQRKSTFDKLLGVEEYEATWQKLLASENLVKDQVAEKTNQISRHEGETDRLPNLELEVVQIQADIEETRAALNQARTDFDLAVTTVTEHEVRATACQSATTAHENRRRDLEAAERDSKTASERTEMALRAREVVVAAEPHYIQYCDAQQELFGLEAMRSERDKSQTELTHLKALLSAAESNHGAVELEIRAAAEAAATIESLQPEMDELQSVEKQRIEATHAAELQGELAPRVINLTDKIMQYQQRLEQLNWAIEALERRGQELPDIEQLESERDALRLEFANADNAQKQVELLDIQLRSAAETIALKTSEIAGYGKSLVDLEHVRATASTLPDIQSAERAAESDRRRVELTLDFQDTARQQLLQQQCPLLDITCPAADEKSWVELRFEQRVTTLKSEYSAVLAQHAEYETALTEGRLLAARLPALEQQERDCDRLTAEREQLELATVCLQEERLAAIELAKTRDELKARGLEKREMIQAARDLERELAGLPAQTNHRDEVSRQLDEWRAEAETLVLQLEPLAELAQQLPRLIASAESKAGAKRRYEEVVALQGQLPQLEKKRADVADKLADLQTEIQRADNSLNQYADLDARLQTSRDIQTSSQGAYESYLRNKSESESYEECVKSFDACTEHVESAKNLLAGAEQALETAKQTYKPDQHENAKQERDRLIGVSAALGRQLENAEESLARRRSEITGLRARMDQLTAALKEREQLAQTGSDVEFIRHIIRAAGPAITESLVQNVTYNASEIFGDVMDDHTLELRWQKDYDVVVRHRAEERPFLQLSGGEQMSAALAVRLALIKQVSEVGVAFFDEPTQNMDAVRRSNLAGQIHKIAGTSGFEQLIVISHDDAFEEHTDTVVRLVKEHEETAVA